MIAHLENLYSFYGTCTGVRVARKHIGWYSRGYRQGVAFRQSVNRAESVDEQLRLTHAFFDRLCETQGMAA